MLFLPINPQLGSFIKNRFNTDSRDTYDCHIAYINEHRKVKWAKLKVFQMSDNGSLYFAHLFDEKSFIIAVSSYKGRLHSPFSLLGLHPLERLLLEQQTDEPTSVCLLQLNVDIQNIEIQDFRKANEYIAFPII